MLPLCPATRCCGNYVHHHAVSVTRVWHRNASLTGAISGGVRKAAAALKSAEKRRLRDGQLGFWEVKDPEKRAQAQDNVRQQRQQKFERKKDLEWLSSDTTLATEPEAVPKYTIGRSQDWSSKAELRGSNEVLRRVRSAQTTTALAKGMLVEAPKAMPYSKAASEFIYGTFAVLAALQAKKRKFYKLYIWCGEDGSLSDNDVKTTEVVREAKAAKVRIIRVAGSWDKLLDRMSDKRPHNGLVLEAAAIPKLSAKYLDKVESIKSPLVVKLNHMSCSEKEDPGLSVGADTIELPLDLRKGRRFPFLLWLDKVTDTGNMGAIFRSAYFLGVDAIILPRHGTAPLTAVTIKNSAGAAEHVPVLNIDNELSFMERSQENGWLFVASGSATSESTLAHSMQKATVEQRPNQVLKHHPLVLMMGNEGEGLRPFLQKQADFTVSIAGARSDGLIDSLNVSVAAALLAQRFLAPYISGVSTGD